MYMILQILSGFTENHVSCWMTNLLQHPNAPKPNRRLSILGQYLREVNHNLRSVT